MIALLFALALLGQDIPQPPDADFPPDLVDDPVWIWRPSGEDLAHYIPAGVSKSGGATAECRIDAKGRLTFCHVIAEDPPGQRWGKATIAITGKFRAAPLSKSGQPTAGKLVRIPMRWNLPPRD